MKRMKNESLARTLFTFYIRCAAIVGMNQHISNSLSRKVNLFLSRLTHAMCAAMAAAVARTHYSLYAFVLWQCSTVLRLTNVIVH